MNKLTHFDASGQAHMVDVGGKPVTHRVAVASGLIEMQPNTLTLIESSNFRKGDVLGIARIAGIMGAKKTSELIPLCHPVALTRVAVDFELCTAGEKSVNACIRCTATAETAGVTGVEIEALTCVQIALLTIYDMCKSADRSMTLNEIKLVSKHGGNSGAFVATR